MKIQNRRDKMKIYGDILFSLCSEPSSNRIVLTHVQFRTRVPFDRLKTYIDDLVALGMLQDNISLKLTDKGRLYLREYEKVLDFMKRMGLAYRE